MSLKYIVPSLGLMVATITPAAAETVGGLSFGGYVDAIFQVVSYDDASPNRPDTAGADEDFELDFNSSAQLEIGYQIGRNVTANIEVFYADGESSFDLEQAYVEWMATDNVSLAVGRFHNHLGWEGLDAPELYRVNQSQVFQTLSGDNVDGVAVGFNANDAIEIGIYLVDGFGFAGPADAKPGLSDLGVGASLTWKVDNIGVFDFDLAYDIGAIDDSGSTDPDDRSDVLHLGVNATLDMWKESMGLLVAADLMYQDWDDFGRLGFMAMANYALSTSTPASVTLMLGYLDRNDDADDMDQLEIAVALLSNPTNDRNFALNGEIRFLSEGADNADEFGFFLEALAVIP